MKLIKNIVIPISEEIDLRKAVSEKLKFVGALEYKILRRSLDARKKNNLKYNYTLLADLPGKYLSHPDVLEHRKPEAFIQPTSKLNNKHPFIIGAGPAGLFAALSLVEKGYKPYIFERGEKVAERTNKVEHFWKSGILDENSNVQFGEGGAGTFSDGKLTSRNRDFYTAKVFDNLVNFGADKKIKIESLPHLGTDGLKKIVMNIRMYLESCGCKFYFNHKLENIEISFRKVTFVTINGQNYTPEILILALGNSARDTFEMLSKKVIMENKPFAVGFRIEHPQDFINKAFYGKQTDISITGPASYRLTAKYESKSIYSFCMCPGGFTVAAASEAEHQVLNGMSYLNRANKFANSGIVVTVNESDFGKELLAGMQFQRKTESECFSKKHPYSAPTQTADNFLKNINTVGKISTSYLPGTVRQDLSSIYNSKLTNSIKSALVQFDKRTPGFIKEGVLMAPETRTSSPVKFPRDRITMLAQETQNLFIIGEGSGFAGGIISSATDGYKLGCTFFEH